VTYLYVRSSNALLKEAAKNRHLQAEALVFPDAIVLAPGPGDAVQKFTIRLETTRAVVNPRLSAKSGGLTLSLSGDSPEASHRPARQKAGGTAVEFDISRFVATAIDSGQTALTTTVEYVSLTGGKYKSIQRFQGLRRSGTAFVYERNLGGEQSDPFEEYFREAT